MAEHLEDRALHADGVAGEDPHGHEAHVGDRRIGDQLLDVGLTEGDQRGVDDGDHAEGEDQRREQVRGLREHRQREAQEAVAAHLQQDARQDDRAGGRRLDVGVGQPGVHRPHRHLHREGGEEGQPQPGLQMLVELVVHELGDRGGARDADHDQDGRQHQHRAEQGVEEELVGRVDPVLAAPDADDQEHRHQAEFEEQVEQHQVQRAEHADDQGLEDQERGHIGRHPLVDREPRGRDADRHQERGQQHEQDRDPVHAHAVVQAREPGVVFHELEAGVGRVVPQHQQQRQREGRERGHQGDPLHGADGLLVLMRTEQAQQDDGRHADQRREGRQGENTGHGIALPLKPARPTARRTAVPPRRAALRTHSDRRSRSAAARPGGRGCRTAPRPRSARGRR